MDNPKKTIELRIEGLTISSEWWTPEFRELMCEICKEDNGIENCNKITCQVGNPWCG